MAGRVGLVAGASGLVGGHLLEALLESAAYAGVISLVRRPSGRAHRKLEERTVDFERVDATPVPAGADVFVTLGTTLAKAGSREAFRRVDHDYVVGVGRAAKAGRAARLLAVSALGADPSSRVFYSRVKGEAEEALAALGLPALFLFRPSFLYGAPPEHVVPPRVAGLPKATEVREPGRVTVGAFSVGAGARAVIAGPCAVESPEQVLRLARLAARAGATAIRGGVFKPRTSPYAFQGHGLEGLAWLRAAGDAVGLPIVTEVMAPAQVGPLAEKADVLQIGARNCQNYDLLREAGASGRAVMLKRGFGTTVDEWLSSAEYLLEAGCHDVMLCERGIRTFEKATRGTLDLCGLLAARDLTHLPILAEAREALVRARFAETLGERAAPLADTLIAFGLEVEG